MESATLLESNREAKLTKIAQEYNLQDQERPFWSAWFLSLFITEEDTKDDLLYFITTNSTELTK